MSKAVELQNVTKQYGSRFIFRDFSMSVETYDSGEIQILGKKIPKIQSKKATFIRRNTINYLFQSFALISDMSVYQNLMLAMNFLDIAKQEKSRKIDEVLQQVNMLSLKDGIVNTLSGGEQQRVALARTILKPGSIVLADEPTGAFDAKSADNAFELVKDLCKKYEKTVILVTHSNELAKRSDRVIDLS